MSGSRSSSHSWAFAPALGASCRAHLSRLMGSWGMLADLCFSDLVLYVVEEPGVFRMLNHIRPSTAQTIYDTNLVGELRTSAQRPLVAEAFASGELTRGDIDSAWLGERIRVAAIPVRCDGQVIAVLAREFVSAGRVRPGALEQTYGGVFDRFAAMIQAGRFPFPLEPVHHSNAPRVGDGVVVLDAAGAVEYSSPNATSALMRFGVVGALVGESLPGLGLDAPAVAVALGSGQPGVDELESAAEVTISLRALPLLSGSEVTGVLVLLRDISDIRQRDRLLLSKDATIREIHHRVKNNLQTISSLLRLQGRRLSEPSAKEAIEDSVRRIRSIALVHETLSRDTGDDVFFSTVLRPLVRMVEEGLVSLERPVRISVRGDAGVVSSALATALSVVLTELMQNAVDHAFTAAVGDREPEVDITLGNDGEILSVSVVDNGVGLPEAFDLGHQESLGLSIVRTLVESELRGSIEFAGSEQLGGTTVTIRIPVAADPRPAEP